MEFQGWPSIFWGQNYYVPVRIVSSGQANFLQILLYLLTKISTGNLLSMKIFLVNQNM